MRYVLVPRGGGRTVVLDETTRPDVPLELVGTLDTITVHLTPSEADTLADYLLRAADEHRRRRS